MPVLIGKNCICPLKVKKTHNDCHPFPKCNFFLREAICAEKTIYYTNKIALNKHRDFLKIVNMKGSYIHPVIDAIMIFPKINK